YHFPRTLLRMRGFRIGRIQEPWTNFVPPIRGGVFRTSTTATTTTTTPTQPEEPETESSGSDVDDSVWSSKGSSLGSRTSSYTDLDLEVKLAKATVTEISIDEDALSTDDSPDCVRRTPFVADEPDILVVELEEKKSSPPEEDITKLSRAAYTIGLEQKEIDNDIRDYPSLDADTQRAIVFDYRALHDKIKSEGFYECRYSEYGKDCVRFAVLFSIFIYFLQAKWYLTSACFLGLFW
ncbi:hypothetical protein LTS18_011029, partial [Coniosporium uncinatum]